MLDERHMKMTKLAIEMLGTLECKILFVRKLYNDGIVSKEEVTELLNYLENPNG